MTNMKTITMIKKLDEMIDIDMLQKRIKTHSKNRFPTSTIKYSCEYIPKIG